MAIDIEGLLGALRFLVSASSSYDRAIAHLDALDHQCKDHGSAAACSAEATYKQTSDSYRDDITRGYTNLDKVVYAGFPCHDDEGHVDYSRCVNLNILTSDELSFLLEAFKSVNRRAINDVNGKVFRHVADLHGDPNQASATARQYEQSENKANHEFYDALDYLYAERARRLPKDEEVQAGPSPGPSQPVPPQPEPSLPPPPEDPYAYDPYAREREQRDLEERRSGRQVPPEFIGFDDVEDMAELVNVLHPLLKKGQE